jgi:hypothetical protein
LIRLIVNVYSDVDPVREAELCEAMRRNMTHPLIGDIIALDGRPTIKEMLAAGAAKAQPEDIVILTNLDVTFDDTLELANDIRVGECYALSRHDENADGSLTLFERAVWGDSQDCWIFRGKPPVVDADFTMGVGGCDNKLAFLLHEAGLELLNPCLSIHAIHLHRSGVRRWRERPRLKPPFVLVKPCTREGIVAA